MADTEDIQPLVCDNGTGMVKVKYKDDSIFKILLAESDWTLLVSFPLSVCLTYV